MNIIEDDDILFFCCKHGLSVFSDDYTSYELMEMKNAVLKGQNEEKNKNSLKLKSALNS